MTAQPTTDAATRTTASSRSMPPIDPMADPIDTNPQLTLLKQQNQMIRQCACLALLFLVIIAVCLVWLVAVTVPTLHKVNRTLASAMRCDKWVTGEECAFYMTTGR